MLVAGEKVIYERYHKWPPPTRSITLANLLSGPPILKLQTKAPIHRTASSDEQKHFYLLFQMRRYSYRTPYQLLSFVILSTGDVVFPGIISCPLLFSL